MKVGFTCSCFDLFHAGHVMMLKEAKTQCDFLIVGLQTDPTIDRPEKNKPVQSVLERYIQLEACKYVDQIVPYATEKELMDILTSHHIDVRIIGEEYRDKQFTGYNLPMGVYFNSRQHSFSTTELRQRVLQANTKAQSTQEVPKPVPKPIQKGTLPQTPANASQAMQALSKLKANPDLIKILP